MKIDVLSLIEDALIGGRNGEMAFIYNNPLMEQIYRRWYNNKQTNNTFKDFLIECLNTKQENYDGQTVITYKPITKRYDLTTYEEKYKEYIKIQNQIDVLKRDQSKVLKELAESKNKELAGIGTYEIVSGAYSEYIEFKVLVEEIMKTGTGEELI